MWYNMAFYTWPSQSFGWSVGSRCEVNEDTFEAQFQHGETHKPEKDSGFDAGTISGQAITTAPHPDVTYLSTNHPIGAQTEVFYVIDIVMKVKIVFFSQDKSRLV